MAYGCGASCAKIILIIFNIIFLLTGLALLAVGIWLVADPNSLISKVEMLEDLLSADRYLNYAAYVMIAAGAFVVIVSVFGCCGAVQESVCLLSVYIALLVAVMIIELACGILAIVFRQKYIIMLVLVMAIEIACGVLAIIFRQKIIDILNDTATCNMYNREDSKCDQAQKTPENFINAFRFVQFKFECCGVKNASDYARANVIVPGKQPQLSWSCCKIKDGDYTEIADKFNDTETEKNDPSSHFVDYAKCKARTGAFHTVGCSTAIMDWLQKYAPILIGLAIALAAFELFVIIFAVCLCRNTTEKE